MNYSFWFLQIVIESYTDSQQHTYPNKSMTLHLLANPILHLVNIDSAKRPLRKN